MAQIGYGFKHLQLKTYITNNCNLSDCIKNIKPNANILSTIRYRTTNFTHKFIWIDSNFKNIIGESEKRRQWECSDENRDESKLKN